MALRHCIYNVLTGDRLLGFWLFVDHILVLTDCVIWLNSDGYAVTLSFLVSHAPVIGYNPNWIQTVMVFGYCIQILYFSMFLMVFHKDGKGRGV